MNKGFVLSFEATLSLILFSLILLSIPQPQANNFEELIIIQQENDLLKIWSKNYSVVEMVFDTKNNFENASLFIDSIEVVSAKKSPRSVASEGILLDNLLNEHRVRIIVYY